MRILLINQFFWPDSAATSQLLTDLARVLSTAGHDVQVLCAKTGYADADESNPPGVSIRRSPSLPFGRKKIGRILSYASYVASAGAMGLFGGKFDLVVTLTTPPLISLLGTMLKFVRGSRHFSWEMDLYPDVVCDLGYFDEKNPLIRIIGILADFSRRRADGVIALGECMKRRLIARGISAEKVHVAENWADGALVQPQPFFEDGKLKILYSGNLGLGHDVATICASMQDLSSDARFHFTFAGGGARRAAVQRFCEENSVNNVTFRPYCSRGSLGRSLGEGDIGLVTQNTNCSGSIVPSKLYGILAAGRPVLYIGPRDSTPAQTIQRFRCGWIVDCGDSHALSTLLERLAANRQEVIEAGARARQAFLEAFELSVGTSRLCSLLFDDFASVPIGRASAAGSSGGSISPEPYKLTPMPRLDKAYLKAEKKP